MVGKAMDIGLAPATLVAATASSFCRSRRSYFMHAQAERRQRMGRLSQDQCSACEHSLQPTYSLQARWVARARALAGHRQGHLVCAKTTLKDHQFLSFKNASVHARSLTSKCREGVEGVVQEWWSGCQHALPPRIKIYNHDGRQGYGQTPA